MIAWISYFLVQNITHPVPRDYSMLTDPEIEKTTKEETEDVLFSSCPSKGHKCSLLAARHLQTPADKVTHLPKEVIHALNTEVFWLCWNHRKIKKVHSLICISVNSGSKKSLASPDPSCGHLELVPKNAAQFAVQTLRSSRVPAMLVKAEQSSSKQAESFKQTNKQNF